MLVPHAPQEPASVQEVVPLARVALHGCCILEEKTDQQSFVEGKDLRREGGAEGKQDVLNCMLI